MIQIISGTKGSGKSKQLIDIANEALTKESGVVVFIDDDKRYMFDLKPSVRFVDAHDYKSVSGYSAETFLAFVSGMLAANFDITLVCIDGLLKIANATLEDIAPVFAQLNAISEAHSCNFVVAMNAEKAELPENLQQYCI